ncbi:MAG: putative metal-dependent hydrolase of the TIM-barrel fold protein, partial [Verrucomicrobiales bacterium]|nr:putative metal-dependent hydrolase of the TIM-barrel fold protein [Verrucomicrobiales bacterium]
VTHTVLLPAGEFYGLEADCHGNESVVSIVRQFPHEFSFFANEVADIPGARGEIKKFLRKGAIGIGEQKFKIPCSSRYIEIIASLAREFEVPVLLHFQEGTYNTGFTEFHKILQKFPAVNFIAHAQTWWANIDSKYDGKSLYPKGKVAGGGRTEKLLTDYPNMFGDLSAGSGVNALTRDEEFTRGFLERHQNKLLFGSDCADVSAKIADCDGARIIDAVRRLASPNAQEKMLHANAKKLLKLKRV